MKMQLPICEQSIELRLPASKALGKRSAWADQVLADPAQTLRDCLEKPTAIRLCGWPSRRTIM